MAYGTVKVDNVTFTYNSADATTTFSGFYASTTDNLTLSGTASAATFTGTTANFTNLNAQNISVTTALSGLAITGGTAGFTTVTGTTVTGTTANFVSGVFTTQVSGTTITGETAGFTTVTGTTVTGTTANFVSGVFTTQVSGVTVIATTGTFTSLTGTTTTMTSGVFASGTEPLPSISFVSDTNTGIYSPGADQLAVATNGVQRINIEADGDINIDGGGVFYDATNNRLAIGTTAPAASLAVAKDGTTGPTGITGTATVSYFSNTAQNRGLGINYDDTNVTAGIYPLGTNSQLCFYTPTSSTYAERMRIDTSGRLLVGTATSRSAGNERIILSETTSNSAGITLVRNTNDTGGPAIGFAKSRGTSVGSNTIVQDGDLLGALFFLGADGVDINTTAASIRGEVDGTPGSNDMPGRLVFSTTPDGASSSTERMRISSDGVVVIQGTANASDNKTITQPNGILHSNRASTANVEHIRFNNPNGDVGSINTSGSSTSYGTSSDYRLKENVTPVTDGITRLQQLKPSRFNFIADPDTEVDGFIAHEAAEVVPECVIGIKDEMDEDGNPVYQGIDQSKLVPLLTAALQEAIGEIESLKARVVALESA